MIKTDYAAIETCEVAGVRPHSRDMVPVMSMSPVFTRNSCSGNAPGVLVILAVT